MSLLQKLRILLLLFVVGVQAVVCASHRKDECVFYQELVHEIVHAEDQQEISHLLTQVSFENLYRAFLFFQNRCCPRFSTGTIPLPSGVAKWCFKRLSCVVDEGVFCLAFFQGANNEDLDSFEIERSTLYALKKPDFEEMRNNFYELACKSRKECLENIGENLSEKQKNMRIAEIHIAFRLLQMVMIPGLRKPIIRPVEYSDPEELTPTMKREPVAIEKVLKELSLNHVPKQPKVTSCC